MKNVTWDDFVVEEAFSDENSGALVQLSSDEIEEVDGGIIPPAILAAAAVGGIFLLGVAVGLGVAYVTRDR